MLLFKFVDFELRWCGEHETAAFFYYLAFSLLMVNFSIPFLNIVCHTRNEIPRPNISTCRGRFCANRTSNHLQVSNATVETVENLEKEKRI